MMIYQKLYDNGLETVLASKLCTLVLYCIVLTTVICNACIHDTSTSLTCWTVVILQYKGNKNLIIIQQVTMVDQKSLAFCHNK